MKSANDIVKLLKKNLESDKELINEIIEYVGGKKIEELDNFTNIEALSRRRPIQEHTIQKASDDVRRKYIVLLSAIALASENINVSALVYINKIANILNIPKHFIDICADSTVITSSNIDLYTMDIIDAKLAQHFIVDATIINCYLSGGNSDDETSIEMQNFLFDYLECSKTEIAELKELAKIIYEKSSEKYIDFSKGIKQIQIENFLGYIKTFHTGIIINNKEQLLIVGQDKSELSDEDKKILANSITKRKIYIADISYSECHLDFVSCGEIIIENSNFSLVKKVLLSTCRNIKISNCEFNGCYTVKSSSNDRYIFDFGYIDTFSIDKCAFKNMYDFNRGFVFKNIGDLKILNTNFSNFTKQETAGLAGLILMQGILFINCIGKLEDIKFNNIYGIKNIIGQTIVSNSNHSITRMVGGNRHGGLGLSEGNELDIINCYWDDIIYDSSKEREYW